MDMFSKDVCALASVDDTNRTALMNAAQQLAAAFTGLLNVTNPGSEEVPLISIHIYDWYSVFSFLHF